MLSGERIYSTETAQLSAPLSSYKASLQATEKEFNWAGHRDDSSKLNDLDSTAASSPCGLEIVHAKSVTFLARKHEPHLSFLGRT